MYKFIGHDNWSRRMPYPSGFPDNLHDYFGDKNNVTILRSSLFFYAGQKTTLEEFNKFFTIKAILIMVHDKFIEIND
jgi:hypothetical protein